MASSISIYSVTLTNSISTAAPSDGFVDSMRIEDYYASTSYALEGLPSGFSLLLSTAKRRGNLRYHEIIRQLELVQNVAIDPAAIVATGANAKTEPTAFSFQLVSLQGDAAWMTRNELVANTYLTGIACIKRCIARALSLSFSRETTIFDPTTATSAGNSTTGIVRYGPRIDVAGSFVIGPYSSGVPATALPNAEAVITVTLLH
jgi:hypothetical protein